MITKEKVEFSWRYETNLPKIFLLKPGLVGCTLFVEQVHTRITYNLSLDFVEYSSVQQMLFFLEIDYEGATTFMICNFPFRNA